MGRENDRFWPTLGSNSARQFRVKGSRLRPFLVLLLTKTSLIVDRTNIWTPQGHRRSPGKAGNDQKQTRNLGRENDHFWPILRPKLGHKKPTVWTYPLKNNKLNAKIYHLNKHNDISCTTRDHQDDQKSTKKVLFFRVEIFMFLTLGADFASQDPILDKSRPFAVNKFKIGTGH